MGVIVIGCDFGLCVFLVLISGLIVDCILLEIGDYEDKKEGKVYKNLFYQICFVFGGNIVVIIVNFEYCF